MVFGKKSKKDQQQSQTRPPASTTSTTKESKDIFSSKKKESSSSSGKPPCSKTCLLVTALLCSPIPVFIQRGCGGHFLLNLILYMLGMGLTITMLIVALATGDGFYLRFGGLFIFAILAILHAVWIIIRPNKFKMFGMASGVA